MSVGESDNIEKRNVRVARAEPARPPNGQDFTIKYVGLGEPRTVCKPVAAGMPWPPPLRLRYDNGDFDLRWYTTDMAIYLWHARRPEHR